jgi:hypothetical protein
MGGLFFQGDGSGEGEQDSLRKRVIFPARFRIGLDHVMT